MLVEAVVYDYHNAPVSREELAVLEFAEKLTRDPAACRERDIGVLREAEWSDRAILDVTLITAYFAFVNRIADGLGIQLESKGRL